VATGRKLQKLKGLSNPTEFSFAPDGCRLLMRNEQSRIAIFSIPSGELLATFAAKHEFRMEGSGCLGPDSLTVLQLAYQGVLLVLDASNGRVLEQRQLEPTGYSGQVHWLPDRNEVFISQTSVSDRNNLSSPCALWRWACPLASHAPERLPGRWTSLHTALLPGRDALVLHHQPSARQRDEFVIEELSLSKMEITRRIVCGGSIIPHPTISHDGKAWAVTTNAGIQLGIDNDAVLIPMSAGGARLHPTRDLVAIPGEEGFVAPADQVLPLLPVLQSHGDEQELTQRGYCRMTTLPNRIMPPRIVVFAGERGWLIQSERLDGRNYLALDASLPVGEDAETHVKAAAIADALARSRSAEGSLEPCSMNERRHFLGGTVTPPGSGWSSAVAVSFADDAIDLWPLKPSDDLAFGHTWYPVAAIEPTAEGVTLVQAVDEMLRHFRPRKPR